MFKQKLAVTNEQHQRSANQRLIINNTLVKYNAKEITEMQCRVYCAHQFGLSDWTCAQFAAKMQHARRKLVLDPLVEFFVFCFVFFFAASNCFEKLQKGNVSRFSDQ